MGYGHPSHRNPKLMGYHGYIKPYGLMWPSIPKLVCPTFDHGADGARNSRGTPKSMEKLKKIFSPVRGMGLTNINRFHQQILTIIY
jgi:hypothetical protein